MTTAINFFEGFYCFKSESTKLSVGENYLQYQLAKQYEYRPTTEALWCSVHNRDEVKYYFLNYENNAFNLILYKKN